MLENTSNNLHCNEFDHCYSCKKCQKNAVCHADCRKARHKFVEIKILYDDFYCIFENKGQNQIGKSNFGLNVCLLYTAKTEAKLTSTSISRYFEFKLKTLNIISTPTKRQEGFANELNFASHNFSMSQI